MAIALRMKDCLEIGKKCGLHTVGASMLNMELHILSIVNYSDIDDTLKGLKDEVHNLGWKDETPIEKALSELRGE